MTYPPIDYKLLKEKKACTEQLDLFKKLFGDNPIPLTDRTIQKFSPILDILWAAENILTPNHLLEFNVVHIPAEKEYEECSNMIWLDHVNNLKPGLEKTITTHWNNYQKIIAKEFVRLYTKET